jgi:hypothetical protein
MLHAGSAPLAWITPRAAIRDRGRSEMRILLRSLLTVIACLMSGCTPTKPLTPADLTGTWQIDRSFTPNLRYTLPASFYDFQLTLNPDGTFAAYNIPDNFFFSHTPTPAASERHGTWKLKPDSDGLMQIYLTFDKGFYGTFVEWNHEERVISMYHDKARFYLTKKK